MRLCRSVVLTVVFYLKQSYDCAAHMYLQISIARTCAFIVWSKADFD